MTVKTVDDGKRARGRPPVGSIFVGVRFPPIDLAALDRWIDGQPDPKPSRPQAVRVLVDEALRK